MTVMDRELFEALKEAGATDETASKAAESVANRDRTMADLKESGMRLEGRVTLLTWMVAFNLAATMAVLWKLIK